jgi:2-hydroxy-3-oxopropionate reductase
MSNKNLTISFLGIGLMGLPMCTNIAKAGFAVKAFNRNLEKLNALKEFGVNTCNTLQEAVSETDIIITMLSDDEAVLDVLNQIIKLDYKKNSVFIDMSSIKFSTAKKIHDITKQNNLRYVDAPVSGGPEGAKSASLAIMAGGDQLDFDNCHDVLKTMGNPTLVGPSGSGQVAKLCNQIIVGVTIGAVAEAIILCEATGADPTKFIQAVAGGFADSKILQNHGNRMVAKDFAPRGKTHTHLKDMNNIIECAKDYQTELPISNLIQKMYQSLVNAGLGDNDHSSLYKEILKLNKRGI